MNNPLAKDVSEAVAQIEQYPVKRPEIALILGSGLGSLAEAVENGVTIPTSDLAGYPISTTPGHQGRLVFGSLEGKNIVVVQGRVHVYEGYDAREAAFPVRLVHALGARKLLVTNAAGGINKSFTPGTLMFITDHINLAFESPLEGSNTDGGPRFTDLSNAYDANWIDQAERLALDAGVATRRGVYLWTMGPSYETKAEINYYRMIGADAVGMSTVPEVIQANYLGMRVLGISTITNPAAGLNLEPLRHEDVIEVGKTVQKTLEILVRRILDS